MHDNGLGNVGGDVVRRVDADVLDDPHTHETIQTRVQWDSLTCSGEPGGRSVAVLVHGTADIDEFPQQRDQRIDVDRLEHDVIEIGLRMWRRDLRCASDEQDDRTSLL